MKILLVSILAALAVFQASAQVSVQLALDQEQFLPDEAIPLAVKIVNTSGQELHLGADPSWLTFSVEGEDNGVVIKNSEVPVVDPFDLESSQMATKYVNLQPYFQMSRPGRYKVTATMRIRAWSLTLNSAPVALDVVRGAQLWTQNFGVAVATNQPPEARTYTLIKANYLRDQLRLYLQVSSADSSQVYSVGALGPMVSFGTPEEQVDRFSKLHVLWQTGGQTFTYIVAGPDGKVISRDIYDNFNSRPRLAITDTGNIVVAGGVRRPKPGDLPDVKMPAPAPISAVKP